MIATSPRKHGGTSVAAAAIRSLGTALLLILFTTRAAAAQSSSMTAECVGSGAGCNQIDFTLTAMGTLPASVDFFRIAITGGNFRFTPAATQLNTALDAVDFNIFASTVSGGGTVLYGAFYPGWEAILNPWLILFTQVEPNTQTGTGSLAFTYEAGSSGRVQFSGAVTATPEPASLVLFATGLLAIGGMTARRRRTA